MKLIHDNPFRILGLPVSATDRQIAKRVAEAETFLAIGKPFTVADVSWLPPVSRTAESIQDAKAKLHRREDRALHAMLWFHGLTTAAHVGGDWLQMSHANRLLDNLKTKQSPSALVDICVLCFSLPPGAASENFLLTGLAAAGILVASEEEVSAYLQTINCPPFDVSRFVRVLLEEAIVRLGGTCKLIDVPTRESCLVAAALAEFPRTTLGWLETQIVADAEAAIIAARSWCGDGRKTLPEHAIACGHAFVTEATPKLDAVRRVLDPADPSLRRLSDLVATECLECAIAYHNHAFDHDLPGQPAVEMSQKAQRLAVGSLLRDRIERDFTIIEGNAKSQRAAAIAKRQLQAEEEARTRRTEQEARARRTEQEAHARRTENAAHREVPQSPDAKSWIVLRCVCGANRFVSEDLVGRKITCQACGRLNMAVNPPAASRDDALADREPVSRRRTGFMRGRIYETTMRPLSKWTVVARALAARVSRYWLMFIVIGITIAGILRISARKGESIANDAHEIGVDSVVEAREISTDSAHDANEWKRAHLGNSRTTPAEDPRLTAWRRAAQGRATHPSP